MPVPTHESELSSVCLLGVAILPPSTIFLLDFRTNPTAWYLFSFIYYYLLNPPGKREIKRGKLDIRIESNTKLVLLGGHQWMHRFMGKTNLQQHLMNNKNGRW